MIKRGGKLANVAIKEILTVEDDDISRQEAHEVFEREAKALSEISDLQHDHIIERVSAITRGEKHYFMFQWADGGNLREFWQTNPTTELTPGRVRDILIQLRGLTDALAALHFYRGNGNYRHGDLKPENILRFKNPKFMNDKVHIGTLKIADMGLARYHKNETDARPDPTSAKYGTARYEPPEVSTNRLNKARSRLYDVWSLGCVVLELMIWALFGFKELEEFNARIRDGNGRFYETQGDGNAQVHPVVVEWMRRMEKEPECNGNTALGDLLAIVREKLLVVDLTPGEATLRSSPAASRGPQRGPVSTGPSRARAEAVASDLNTMIERGSQDETYLLKQGSRQASSLQIPYNDNRGPGCHDGSSTNTVRHPSPDPNLISQTAYIAELQVCEFSLAEPILY